MLTLLSGVGRIEIVATAPLADPATIRLPSANARSADVPPSSAAHSATTRQLRAVREAYFLEFAAPGVTKGAGLQFLAEHMGFTREQAISFGDGENDVELVERAGFGIAVEDANPLLLERADWTCPSADEEGVAAVIDAYLDSLR